MWYSKNKKCVKVGNRKKRKRKPNPEVEHWYHVHAASASRVNPFHADTTRQRKSKKKKGGIKGEREEREGDRRGNVTNIIRYGRHRRGKGGGEHGEERATGKGYVEDR